MDLVAGWGCDGIGLNPLHVLFRERPRDCSRIRQTDACSLNPLYIDVEIIAVSRTDYTGRSWAQQCAAQRSCRYDVVAEPLAELRSAYDRFEMLLQRRVGRPSTGFVPNAETR